MQFKAPKNNDKYFWTGHALGKMQYYGLTAQRILRVINKPMRIEEGVAEKTTAVMQPGPVSRKDGKWHREIWAMYQLIDKKYKIISAWRYPGVSPKRNAVPEEIMEEVKDFIS
ncbi:MAG: hypothetical protein PHF50_00840 [Patescibacteria group bacterium]|nr:hypothetical protein [Patescibacteria group bacterium]